MKFRSRKSEFKRLESSEILQAFQDKFSVFLDLLDRNNYVLEIMSDMEEKAQGEYLFDINYIRNSLSAIRAGVKDIIDNMISIGGDSYSTLKDRFAEIDGVVETLLPGNQPIMGDDFTLPFDRLNRNRALSVGSKNAQLGEIKANLGLPVPEGFAITASAYKYFVEANNLQERITRRIDSVDIKSNAQLERISSEIIDMVTTSCVPEDLSDAIMASYDDLSRRSRSHRFSMRSSAIGEDTLFSFAGQYASYLNVGVEQLIDRYREILASKFTPQAIYYFLSHSLSEAELAMSVGCVSMIDAASSGVIYTQNPIDPEDDAIIINSIFGLGKYLVNGTLTPDVFRVTRTGREIIERSIACKPFRLVMSSGSGTVRDTIAPEHQNDPSLTDDQLHLLVEYALKLAEHYRSPQDVEWALDQSGQLFILQSRPLQVIKDKGDQVEISMDDYSVLVSGGSIVCPGAGCGPVYHVTTAKDLPAVPQGAVLVAPHPFPGLITVMGRIEALVTKVGGLASHMATIAREYHIPTLAGIDNIADLPEGRMVTVDATGRAVYEGRQNDVIEARRPGFEILDTSGIYNVLDRVLDLVSPLRLLHPSDDDFKAENCVTYHDITRFVHQKSMEEMFISAQQVDRGKAIGYKLKSSLPVDMNVIYIDRAYRPPSRKGCVSENRLDSVPMNAFWKGVKEHGWPTRPRPAMNNTTMGTSMDDKERQFYSESSFAILSKEYMILSLRMGYHFTTVEAMCTPETSKNYIQIQYKDGGAALDRRIRRIKLLTDILSRMGFLHERRGDFLYSIISYQDFDAMMEKLRLLGRLILMTKQLDMALSNDAVAEWYTGDFIKKLGLGQQVNTDEKERTGINHVDDGD